MMPPVRGCLPPSLIEGKMKSASAVHRLCSPSLHQSSQTGDHRNGPPAQSAFWFPQLPMRPGAANVDPPSNEIKVGPPKSQYFRDPSSRDGYHDDENPHHRLFDLFTY